MNRLRHFLLSAFLFLFMPLVAFAADVADKVDKVAEGIPVEGAILGGIAVVVELILRAFPSEKPKSIMFIVAKLLLAVGKFADRLGTAMNYVRPKDQDPQPPQEPQA